MGFLHKTSVVSYCKDLIWEVIVIFEFLKSLKDYIVTVEQAALVKLMSIVLILIRIHS